LTTSAKLLVIIVKPSEYCRFVCRYYC